MLWKGILHFKQYLSSKRQRFRIKIFISCNCRTGFLLDFVTYIGSETQIQLNKKLRIPGSTVMTLVQSYLQKGHNLFEDNCFTSPDLFEVFHDNKTRACGRVCKTRFGMPNFTDKLDKDGSNYQHIDILLVVKWFDKKMLPYF